MRTVISRRRPGRESQNRRGSSRRLDLADPIPYVPHPAFRRKNVETELRRRMARLPSADSGASDDSQPGLTYVAGFASRPLLTPDEEATLFAQMNFHKFRAEQLRRRGRTSRAPKKLASRIRVELERALMLRNRIVESNLRLVVSLARQLSRSLDQMSELISEGTPPLIRAVELFDVSLGNRFSTYATWAVRNQMVRCLQRAKSASRLPSIGVSWDERPAASPPCDDADATTAAVKVQGLLALLPPRERDVVKARFGLDGEPEGQSLAEIARRLGLSKERVRQIVLNSLKTLRESCPEPIETT
jgi:RNA polymerase sigma factor (sigma-70 family)